MADALARAGRLDEAFAVLADAEDICAGDEFFRAETRRVRAELLARRGAPTDAVEGSFRAALECARRQQAKTFELRAGTSYARWLQDRRRAAAARDLLAPVYAWYTEGFDTRDLQDAKALLTELAK
jgi:predicted ATPase